MTRTSKDDVVLGQDRASAVLPMLLGGAVIVAALYYGQELVVPLVLAAMLAFVLAPLCARLQRLWLPRTLAVLVAVMVTFATLGGLGALVGRQVASLAAGLPAYQTTITTKWNAIMARVGTVENLTKDIGKGNGGKGNGGKDDSSKGATTGKPADEAKGGGFGLPTDLSGLTLARSVALPILGPIGTLGVTLIFAFFILLSADDLRDRLVRLVGRQDLHRTILAMNDAASRLSRYFLYQLALNTMFGAVIGIALWIAGLPSPLLWGILAGIMRFVPFLGVVVAAVPPLLLAIAVVPDWSLAIVVLALFAAAEGVMGQVVEPLIYGHNTGLSPLAVIVATAFWALLWGPIGLLIATPLTVCLVVIGRHVEALAFFDVILGDEPPLDPPETLYQRALEGRGTRLAPDARKRVAAASFADYCDRVALPGLALAQGDLARDDFAFERLEEIHSQISAMLEKLRIDTVRDAEKSRKARGEQDELSPAAAVASPAWRAARAVVCLPGRGQLDDLAATMAVYALADAGFGAAFEPNAVLSANEAMPQISGVKLCCLSILELGSTEAAIRYFIRRVGRQMPGAIIVVGLWHADRDSASLAALRQTSDDIHVVLSIGELVAFCQAMATRHPAAAIA